MLRSRVAVLSAAVGTAALLAALAPARGQAQKWVTVNGRITLKAAPVPGNLNVTADKEHCLSNGPLIDDEVIVDAKSKGLKNVFVWIMPEVKDKDGKDTIARSWPAGAVNPALKAAPKQVEIDQPCCQFVPRVLAARDGDTLLVKNTSPVPHNINISTAAWSMNPIIPPKGQAKGPADLRAEWPLIPFACNIHPWMKGTLMVFDHPYYALTDADGKFEIKGVPAARLRIMYRHEKAGNHKGADGGKGFPIDTTNGANLDIQPFDFEFAPPKAK